MANRFKNGNLVVIRESDHKDEVGMQGVVTDVKDGCYYELDHGSYYYKEDALDLVSEGRPVSIDRETYKELVRLGILNTSVRSYNRGSSDYSRHLIQPWSIWIDWDLNPWDADIVKRVLRTKEGESRRLDYEKIIHICEERIRQIDSEMEDGA